MRICFIAVILLAAAIAQAGQPADPTFERLSKVDRFALGPTGYAGGTSQGEKDYKIILSRPSAIADFEKLLSVGNPQAKAYALAGIRVLNVNRFKELSHPLLDSKEMVVTQSGCIVSHQTFQAVLEGIEAGEYPTGR